VLANFCVSVLQILSVCVINYFRTSVTNFSHNTSAYKSSINNIINAKVHAIIITR